jgi:hypothetical protein
MGVDAHRRAIPVAWAALRAGWLLSLFVLVFSIAGCERQGAGVNPEEGPGAVVKRFYELVSEATREGGSTSARLAYGLISSDRSRLRVEEFMEVVKKYPEGLTVDVGEADVNGTRALVGISYTMPSMFNDGYTVHEVIPLTVDEDAAAWKIDFTGETYGMDKETAAKMATEEASAMLDVGLGETE